MLIKTEALLTLILRNGTPWVLNSEIFDQSVRSLGQASAAANNWFWNFIIARFTPQMFLSMGKNGCGVYFFFATMMILSIIFVFFLIPETKGIPLERYVSRVATFIYIKTTSEVLICFL